MYLHTTSPEGHFDIYFQIEILFNISKIRKKINNNSTPWFKAKVNFLIWLQTKRSNIERYKHQIIFLTNHVICSKYSNS